METPYGKAEVKTACSVGSALLHVNESLPAGSRLFTAQLAASGRACTLGERANSLRPGVARDSVYPHGRSVVGVQNKLGISGTTDANGVPGINISGFAGSGTSTGLPADIDNVYRIHESFNWLSGNHPIKFGDDLDYTHSVQSSANANARRAFNFKVM